MIETDGRPTIASRRADPLLREALEKGGHLGDEVARVILSETPEERHARMRDELWAEVNRGIAAYGNELSETLVSDDEALD